MCLCFFFNDTATTEIYTLSLHDALPIYSFLQTDTVTLAPRTCREGAGPWLVADILRRTELMPSLCARRRTISGIRSEEHTSELQSRQYLVCRLLLEKKNSSRRSLASTAQ